MTSIRQREKILAKLKEKPDPREAAPAIKEKMLELHQKMTEKVNSRRQIKEDLHKNFRTPRLHARAKSTMKTCGASGTISELEAVKSITLSPTDLRLVRAVSVSSQHDMQSIRL